MIDKVFVFSNKISDSAHTTAKYSRNSCLASADVFALLRVYSSDELLLMCLSPRTSLTGLCVCAPVCVRERQRMNVNVREGPKHSSIVFFCLVDLGAVNKIH